MRLADRIIAGTRKPSGDTRFFVNFANALQGAVPFEITEDVGRIATAIKHSDAKKLRSIHNHCRVPFQKIWIEWVGTSHNFGEAEYFVEDGPEEDINFNQPKPDRCGVLVEADGENYGRAMMTFAWSHPNAGFNVSPVSFVFDWTGGQVEGIPKMARATPEEMRAWFPKYRKDSDEDLIAIDGHSNIGINPHMAEWWTLVIRSMTPDQIRPMWRQFMADIKGEGGFAEGVIAAINSRNLVSVSDPDDMTRINKARRKLRRPPLLAFRTVRLSLSRSVERKRSDGAGAPMPLHMVRGHFKVRKSGIYWWAPFWRGDASVGVISKRRYEVVA